MDQLVEGIYRALETTEERLDGRCDDIYFPMDLTSSALTSKTHQQIDRHQPTQSSSIGSSPSSEGVLIGSGGCSEGLGLGLSTLSRATSIFGICTRIFTALQDAVDSVGVVDRCSGTSVDRL
ncbi:hypothetical protein F2Q70_00004112 [Brassica cretica]|uniref:Uncharacterized protein n=1 Tax=Brassica cretica TaxID=69181 RepID=A0A8S9INV6_BRACR|nr:hypothetical protein F2Q70_00004112 [Brassica cretica]